MILVHELKSSPEGKEGKKGDKDDQRKSHS